MSISKIFIAGLLLTMVSLPVQAQDPDTGCSIKSIEEGFVDRPKQRIREIQKWLKDGGYNTGGTHGKFGPKTKQALAEFCLLFDVDKQRGGETLPRFITKLLRRSAIVSIDHPDWMTLSETELFQSWLAQESQADAFKDVNKGGDDDSGEDEWVKQVIAILDSYGFIGNKPPQTNAQPANIVLKGVDANGEDCGCSQDFSKLVYGFYPYQLATGVAQDLDFSLLKRIGFYGLTVNNEGKIENDLQWTNDRDTKLGGFINAAHRHRVKVDVSFYAAQWQEWEKNGVIEPAAIEMVEHANLIFSDTEASQWRNFIPLLEDTAKVKGDGINLYFDQYTMPEQGEALVKIVTVLDDQWIDRDPKANFNIMIRFGNNNGSAELFRPLEKLFYNRSEDDEGNLSVTSRVDNIFVFLGQDTSTSKKELRRNIEDAFKGEVRRTALRKVIPIVPVTGAITDKDQFDDDLIYFEDNFNGVGLWPLPLASLNEDDPVGRALKARFLDHEEPGLLGENFDNLVDSLCQFACPNRWLFRIALDLLIAFGIIYALAAMGSCRLRELYQRGKMYFFGTGAVGAGDLSILSVCDPFWQERADNVVLGILLVIVLGLVTRSIRKTIKPTLP